MFKITSIIIICCSLLGITGVQGAMRVPLERKAAGVSAQHTADKIKTQLLKTGGIGGLFGQKNVDDHGPVTELLKEFTPDERPKSVYEHLREWLLGFAPRAAAPPKFESRERTGARLGEVDFSDMHQNELKRRLYDSVMKEQERLNLDRVKRGKRGHPLVQTGARIDISNVLNLQYIGPVFMGSANEQLGVIYDTGSDWLVLDTDFCSTCHAPVFNTAASTSYVNLSTQARSQTYGSAQLWGYSAQDVTALADHNSGSTTKLDDFNFLAIAAQSGIRSTFDGILGFSRQYHHYYFSSGPLFLEGLKNASKISREQISFYMTNTNGQSFADIGDYDTSNMKGGDASNIAWLYMPSKHLFWYSNLQAIKIGYDARVPSSGFVAEWALNNTQPAIFDTGTSLILVPTADADDLFYRLLYGRTYIYDNGFIYVDCNERSFFPDVHLLINDRWFVVTNEDYFGELQGSCYLAFVEDDSASYWLLGDAFLRGYYSIHDNEDHDNAKMGIIPHANSTKPFVTYGTVPEIKATDLEWERSWLYDIYWSLQNKDWLDTWLDSKWWYKWQGQLWVALFGPASIRRTASL